MEKRIEKDQVHVSDARHRIMASIRSKNTKPEVVLRKRLHHMGFRYRIHSKRLPGKPDIVLPKYKIIILVHGCFWHKHDDCKYFKVPSTNREFWLEKLSRNEQRDQQNIEALVLLGWKVLVVWECEIMYNPEPTIQKVVSQITDFHHDSANDLL